MIDLIRSWLIGVTATALVAAVADCLTPEGTVKKIGKLACGLLLLVAILKPIITLDYSAMAGILADYRLAASGYDAALESENQRLLKSIIEEETSAYIQDKAAQAGASCSAEVTCMCDDAGNLYPGSVCVIGDLTEAQTEALRRLIESDLAIPAQNQQYERTQPQ